MFGQLNLAQSLAVQGMGIATCGLDTAGIRQVASSPASTPATVATVVLLRFLLGLVGWGIIGVLSWCVPQYRDCFELTCLYGISLLTGALTVSWVAQARGRLHVVGLAMLTTHVMYFAGVYVAIRREWPAAGIPLLMVVAEALSAAGLWIWLTLCFGRATRPLPPREALKFLRETVPIGGANVLRSLIAGSDILLLGLFVDDSDVGLYSGAFKIYSLGLSLIALYCAVLLPQLAACAAETRSAVRPPLRASLRRTLLATLAVVPIAFFAAGAVLRFLFGPDFAPATVALQALIVSLPVSLVAVHYRIVFVALRQQRHLMHLMALGALFHVGAKIVLIAALGITGAAWGTLVGETALMLLLWRAAGRLLDTPDGVE